MTGLGSTTSSLAVGHAGERNRHPGRRHDSTSQRRWANHPERTGHVQRNRHHLTFPLPINPPRPRETPRVHGHLFRRLYRDINYWDLQIYELRNAERQRLWPAGNRNEYGRGRGLRTDCDRERWPVATLGQHARQWRHVHGSSITIGELGPTPLAINGNLTLESTGAIVFLDPQNTISLGTDYSMTV